MFFFHAAERAMEIERTVVQPVGLPALVVFGFHAVEFNRQRFGQSLLFFRILHDGRIKHAGHRQLLDDFFRRFLA